MDGTAYKYMKMAADAAAGVIPVGSNIVAYVRSTGQNSSDSSAITSKFYTSLTSALAACTSGRRDVIIVLPGHSEAVGTTMFSGAATDVRIIGVGAVDEDLAPTFKWSVSSSNWAIASKNITVANCRLLADADGITEMITITAAGVKIMNCWIDAGVSSSLDASSVINISTGANQCSLICNDMRGTAATGVVTYIKGGTVVDEAKIIANKIVAAGSSTTTGLIDITAAMTNVYIARNHIDNQKAAGTAAITMADVAITGSVAYNTVSALANNASPAAKGILLAGTSTILCHFFENYFSDGVLGTSGILTPVVTS